MYSADASTAGPVRRLRVRWRDGRWSIQSERRVARMTLPAPSRLPKVGDVGQIDGFWFELADKQGNVLYRRIMDDPLGQTLSLANPDGTWTNVDVEQPDVLIEVLVPDRPEYAELRFYGRQVSTKQRAPSTQSLGMIDLQERPPGQRRRRK